MSAYVLDREHFVAIAAFLRANGHATGTSRLYHYEPNRPSQENYYEPERIANVLMAQNLRSVAYRYSEDEQAMEPVTDTECRTLARNGPVPTPGRINGILRSLQYQSCETDDYYTSEAFYLTHKVCMAALAAVAMAELARVEQELTPRDTFEWA